MHTNRSPRRVPRALAAAGAAGLGTVALSLAATLSAAGPAGAAPMPAPLRPCLGSGCDAAFPPINNGPLAGRDEAVSVFVGGSYTVRGSAAEAEGRVVTLGAFAVDRTVPGQYEVGPAGAGSRVPPPNGTDWLVVGGATTVAAPASRLHLGGSGGLGGVAGGDFRHAGTATGAITVDPPGRDLADPDAARLYAGLRPQITELSDCADRQTDTGKVTISGGDVTFTGDGTSPRQVFDYPGNIGTASTQGQISLTGIPAGATVIVNMTGPHPSINTFSGGNTAIPNSPDPFRDRLLWNFPNASTVTLAGTAQFMGSVLVGPASSTTTLSMPGTNGRFSTAGDFVHTGTGAELHNYPFTGDMPDCQAPPSSSPSTASTASTEPSTASSEPSRGPSSPATVPTLPTTPTTHPPHTQDSPRPPSPPHRAEAHALADTGADSLALAGLGAAGLLGGGYLLWQSTRRRGTHG